MNRVSEVEVNGVIVGMRNHKGDFDSSIAAAAKLIGVSSQDIFDALPIGWTQKKGAIEFPFAGFRITIRKVQ